MIAIDSSALSAIVLREKGWENLLSLSDIFVTVELALKEASNVIWSAVISRRLSEEEAFSAHSILMDLAEGNILLREQLQYLKESLELAISHRITVYDAIFISLAKRESLPLLTLDERQREAAEEEGVRVLP